MNTPTTPAVPGGADASRERPRAAAGCAGTPDRGPLDHARGEPLGRIRTNRAAQSPHYREHTLQETTLGATAMYQFFENQWVHPVVGVGAELVRERDRADALPPITIRPTPAPSLIVPALPAIDKVSYSVRPLVTGGFKFYVSPRAFVRTEVRTALSTDRGLALQWRGGVGFDF